MCDTSLMYSSGTSERSPSNRWYDADCLVIPLSPLPSPVLGEHRRADGDDDDRRLALGDRRRRGGHGLDLGGRQRGLRRRRLRRHGRGRLERRGRDVGRGVRVCQRDRVRLRRHPGGGRGRLPRRLHERVRHDGRDDIAGREGRRARREPPQHIGVGERLRLRRRQRDDQAQRLLGVLDQPDLAALGQREHLPEHRDELFRLGGQAGQVDVPDLGGIREDPDGHAVRDLEALLNQDFSGAGQQPVPVTGVSPGTRDNHPGDHRRPLALQHLVRRDQHPLVQGARALLRSERHALTPSSPLIGACWPEGMSCSTCPSRAAGVRQMAEPVADWMAWRCWPLAFAASWRIWLSCCSHLLTNWAKSLRNWSAFRATQYELLAWTFWFMPFRVDCSSLWNGPPSCWTRCCSWARSAPWIPPATSHLLGGTRSPGWVRSVDSPFPASGENAIVSEVSNIYGCEK